MSFEVCAGNPPFQISRLTTKDMPVYHLFMEAAYKIAEIVILITPARFLFNAGATPKQWNKEMLDDEHFKVLKYYEKGVNVFTDTDIKGGVAIHCRNKKKVFNPIKVFVKCDELNSIYKKVSQFDEYKSINTIMFPYSIYTLSKTFWDEFPTKKLSNTKIITTNIFDLLPGLFIEEKPNDGNEYICMVGRQNNKICKKYIRSKYINTGGNHTKWKVIIPNANGSGKLGEIGNSHVIPPLTGYTQTYLSIGSFGSYEEADAANKYIGTKFCKACLSILKVTQHQVMAVWEYVPLQDFTNNSDIDWTKSIPKIDQQLYKKYQLSQDEIDFIETHIKYRD